MEEEKSWFKEHPNWKGVIIILLILIGYSVYSYSNKDFKSCVEDCVWEIDMCLWDYTKYVKTTGYILSFDAEGCVLDLEICIDWCDS